MGSTWRRRMARGIAATALAAALMAGVAQAHAYIASIAPQDGAVLAHPPSQVRVEFTEPVEARLTQLTLRDGQGREVAGTRQEAQGDRVLVLELPPLPAGSYTLETKTVARDGHVTEQATTFSVAAASRTGGAAPALTRPAPQVPAGGEGGQEAAPGPAASAPAPREARLGPWAWVGLALAAVLLLSSGLYGLLTRPRYNR